MLWMWMSWLTLAVLHLTYVVCLFGVVVVDVMLKQKYITQ